MSFGIKQKTRTPRLAHTILEEFEKNQLQGNGSSELTFRRLYLSVFVLAGALFFLYCSCFYVGAFVDVGKIIGYNHIDRTEFARDMIQKRYPIKSRSTIQKIMSLFELDRVYLRQGQTITASYALPQKTELVLSVVECANRPIMEVFDCKVIGRHDTKIAEKRAGVVKFRASEPGFYHFTATVANLPKTPAINGEDYFLMWLRN